MNTKTAPESCPFCGAGKKRHLPHIAFRWFECGTMTAPAKTPRRDQTPACADAERERLTQERDEARAERDDLLARIKRLEEAGDAVVSEPCEYTFDQWIQAKEDKP